MRTRIKICGLTREADVAAASAAGADAVGFVCYPKSPRFVDPHRLHALARELGPFTVPVLLFVNAPSDLVDAAREAIPNAVLQFHGDEHEAECARHGAAYVRAIRMSDGVDLLDCERLFSSAAALLVDAPSAVYGGSGEAFDWSRIPRERTKRLILAGGLHRDNVESAVRTVRPYAVDVSSGVEEAPGIKSAARIGEFIDAVRRADRHESQ
ncbi:MAG: phosphoribosylanthranilate isomerase [Burkholderiaceae bacterium]